MSLRKPSDRSPRGLPVRLRGSAASALQTQGATVDLLAEGLQRLQLLAPELALLGLSRPHTIRRLLYIGADGVMYSLFVVCETRA
jgi:hypothetical protein